MVDIIEILNQLKNNSDDYFILHDMRLPISAETLYNIMKCPENWKVVNYPIISRADLINQKNNSVSFILCEKLLRKDYQSHISLTFDDEKKYIEYYHNKPTFPFVESMASMWYFVDESNAISHFYIIRRFDLKNRFVKYFLFWLVKKIINKHVADYYEQLIVLSKAITINSFINNK